MRFPDVGFKGTWLWAVAVVLVIIVVIKFARPVLIKIMKSFFAFTMYFFTKLYNKKLGPKKKELFESMEKHLEEVEGDLLEVGAGTGANFAFYPRGCSIVALDPNPYMNYYLLHTEKFYPHVILRDYIVGTCEDMRKIKDQSVSAVVSTLVLCSVESVELSLREIIRVLKPVSQVCNLLQRSQPDSLVILCKYFVFADRENNQFLKK